MLHWKPNSKYNKCPTWKYGDPTTWHILGATCEHCLTYGLTFCQGEVAKQIEQRLKELTYKKDFDKMIKDE